MRLAYFDCFSGISGDMALGALLGAGAPLDHVADALATLPIGPIEMATEDVETHGITATRVSVRLEPQGVIRTYASIRSMLTGSGLPDRARWTAQRIFHRLAQAEARVHHKEPDVVVFHGGGDRDVVVDVVGCALALEMLGIERVFASPVPTGMGMVRTEHGMMPVPGPVVMELLQGVPTYSRGIPAELVSAAGAAILAATAEGFGDMPMMRVEQVGYGAGAARLDFPNVLRVAVGVEERIAVQPDDGSTVPLDGREFVAGEAALLVQATVAGLDATDVHATTELFGRLRAAGAVETWLAPVIGPGGAAVEVSAVAGRGGGADVARVLAETPGAGRVRVAGVGRPPRD